MGLAQQGRVRSHRSRGCMHVCITRASLCQCACCVPCNAAPFSGVLGRLPAIGGSSEASLGDVLDGTTHVVELLRVRLPHPAEQKQTGHDGLDPLPLQLDGLVVELAMLHVICATRMNNLISCFFASVPGVHMQQVRLLLYFCAICGHCTQNGQRGRAPGARRGAVPLDGMRAVRGRGVVSRPAWRPAATLSPFC